MIKTNNLDDKSSVDNNGNTLIKGEKKPWNDGTIHILWPSVSASYEDESYVAWCRESAIGELKKPSDLLPVENNDRICKTCIEKAIGSKSIDTPEFVDDFNLDQN